MSRWDYRPPPIRLPSRAWRPEVRDQACEGCGEPAPCRFVPAHPVTRTRPDGVAYASMSLPGWYCAGCRQERLPGVGDG